MSRRVLRITERFSPTFYSLLTLAIMYKKHFAFTACTLMIAALFVTSCSDPKQIEEVSVNAERQEQAQSAIPANDVVIVRVSHGKNAENGRINGAMGIRYSVVVDGFPPSMA